MEQPFRRRIEGEAERGATTAGSGASANFHAVGARQSVHAGLHGPLFLDAGPRAQIATVRRVRGVLVLRLRCHSLGRRVCRACKLRRELSV